MERLDEYRKAFAGCEFDRKEAKHLEDSVDARTIDEIVEGYHSIAHSKGNYTTYHLAAARKASKLVYTNDELNALCRNISGYFGKRSAISRAWEYILSDQLDIRPRDYEGIYISALAQSLCWQDGVVEISPSEPLSFLGFLHNKGKLVINGNAAVCLGREMSGGKIVLKGNAGNFAGSFMRGGELVIEGNCGKYPGEVMAYGAIKVNGKIKKFDSNRVLFGEIWAQGRRIFP